MGGVTSKNVVDAITNSMIAVANKSSQTAKTTVNQGNNVVFKGCDVSNTTINQTDNFQLNTQLFNSGNFQNQISADISEEITQIATAISQNITVNPTSTEAENVAKAIINNKVEIVNSFMQVFQSSYSSKNSIRCTDSTLTGDVFNQTVVDNIILQGMQTAISGTGVAVELTEAVAQTAYAKQENALLTLVLIIIAILGIVFLTGGKIVTQLTSPSFIVTIAPLAISIGLLIALYAWRQWPFASG